ncbi:DinB family protein [Paenibacillaceae bacterium WGS1546]|uniref:DinB family protein n=1 Tax=Cohnella sp. WGS1546 TaxID=3366810 RepID=UPI00372D4BA8
MKTILRMMDHLYWANKRMHAALLAEPAVIPEIVTLLRHIVASERVWLTRLEGKSSAGYSLWEEAELAPLIDEMTDNERGYRRYAAGLTERRLDELVRYANQSGQSYETSIRDILTHVALHGQYHRGQINVKLRATEGHPVGMDFILFAREGGAAK